MKPENGATDGFESVVVKEEKHKPEYDKYAHPAPPRGDDEQQAPGSGGDETNEYGSVQQN